MDFAELRNQYENNKENLEALLQKLGVNNIEAAKLKKEEPNGIHNDIVSLENKSQACWTGLSMKNWQPSSVVMAIWAMCEIWQPLNQP